VQEGISRINQAEGRVAVADGNIEAPGNKAIIRENMQYIEETMQRQRELIDQLKQKLQSSSVNVDKLQKTVASLEKQVQEQGVRIQELEAQLAEKNIVIEHQTEEISNLNSSVSELTTQNEQQAATLAAQEQDLNTGWFVFGTKTELTEQKILQKGEVLRSEDFATDYFTKVDIRQTQNIKFYSKSAKMLTTHPAGSYRLSKNDDGEYELHILNTKKFWSVSRFLVVLVK
jgi:septal ring factor EnvC (AmiA/AmiB activator)